jgi:ribonuclease BN (tRNA processing enzyme)
MLRVAMSLSCFGRREILVGGGALAMAAALTGPRAQTPTPPPVSNKGRTRLVLIGTKGGPRVGGHRANPANLLLVDGVPYVIDCGYGVARGLVNAGLALPRLKYIFITHHHSDHNLEYGNLLDAAWSAGLNSQVQSFGPKGLVEMTRLFWEMNRFDVETRIEDEGKPDLRKLLVPKEIDEGPVLDAGRVKVTAFRTPHPPIVDNFAYNFETPDGKIVFSGDTAYNPKLAEFARGADILVHECLYEPGVDKLVASIPSAQTLKKHLMDSHTKTDDVGRIAAQAGVKILVLSHFVPGDDPTITDEMWISGARQHFNGRIIAGKDLMAIDLPISG